MAFLPRLKHLGLLPSMTYDAVFLNHKPVGVQFWNLEYFLERMRDGSLPENFMIADEVWGELVTRINVDPKLAREILDCGILLMLGAVREAKIGEVVALAEACCEREEKTNG